MDMEIFEKLRQFDCTVAGEALDVYEISLEEGLFSDFEAIVTVVAKRRLKIHDYLGKDALLTLIGRKSDRYVHGMIKSMEEMEE
ncbi:MAG: hypothetical protein KKD44_24535, partial [Proteobacteria bacterium]|nr:hypothetical protein [Pseudomonadota bacterium]